MSNKKRAKKTIWIYAVILFTSAFIVLLIAGLSQIKMTKSLDFFKNQISSGEKEKMTIQEVAKSLSDENIVLKDENKKLKDDVKNTKEELVLKLKDFEIQQQKNNDVLITNYELLLRADEKFQQKDYINCSDILLKINNVDAFGNDAKSKYNILKEKSYLIAARDLYNRGYNYYLKGLYQEAIINLKQSLELANSEYYSDDCLFFIAYSQFNLGYHEESLKTIDNFNNIYQSSNYINEIKILKNKINK